MLDTIKNVTDVAAGERVLIKAADVAAARQRRELLRQAQREASKVVAQAQEQAEDLRLAAYHEGYAQGALHAASDLGELLLLEHGVAARVRAQASDTLKQMLDDLLVTPQWTQLLLERWMAEGSCQVGEPLHVLVPARCKAAVVNLRERLQQCWSAAVHIEFHASQAFVFRVGEQCLELNVPLTIEHLAPRLSAQFSALREGPAAMNQAAAEKLKDWVERFTAQCLVDTQVQS